MLCKDKITSIFCIIDDILKEINHSEDIPPLAQACSLCPIQNSKFKIPQTLSEPTAKDERRFSEGKSASWRSRVCDEG